MALVLILATPACTEECEPWYSPSIDACSLTEHERAWLGPGAANKRNGLFVELNLKAAAFQVWKEDIFTRRVGLKPLFIPLSNLRPFILFVDFISGSVVKINMVEAAACDVCWMQRYVERAPLL